MRDWTGQTLDGRFKVGRRLGQGGMAAVYLASDLRLSGRPVVVKHPLREADRFDGGLSDEDLRRRFGKEIEGLTRLDDIPHVVPILDQGVHEGTPFYVMRHMAGGSLFDLLKGGPQAPGEALAWLRPVAQALDRLHRRGVLHRDVKPENLLFDRPPGGPDCEPPQAYLSDFGIVKELAAQWATTGKLNTGIGTPGYMAPEQLLEDAEPDGRADQFSLAATLYYALTGSRPLYATTAGAGGGAVAGVRKRLTPVSLLAPHVPAACSAAIEKALSRDFEDRFPTCTAFVEAFEAALDAGDRGGAAAGAATAAPTTRGASAPGTAALGPSKAVRPGKRGRRRWPLLLLAVVTLGGVGYAVLPGLLGGPTQDRDRPVERSPGPAAPAPAPAPTPAPAPAPVPDVQAPQVQVSEPGSDLTTTSAKVRVTGTVSEAGGPLGAVVLKDGEAVVALDSSGAFTHEVSLGVDEERVVRLVATDGAGNRSEAVVRRLRREASWAAALREAEAARAKEDGEGVKAALAKAKAADVPLSKAEALTEYVRLWDAEPVVQVTGSTPEGEAVAGGPPRAMRVRGTLTSGRSGDRLLVDGKEAAAKPGAFEVTVARSAPGTTEVPYEVRTASGVVRKQGTLAVTFETPAPRPEVQAVPSWARVTQAQKDEAARLKVPVAYEEAAMGLRFVLIPGGSFQMGSPESDARRSNNEVPMRWVTLQAYYLSVTEVTNAQYKRFKADHDGRFDGPTQPVENVSHEDAEAFARWLNGRGTEKGYRLPSEAEWEHAARAGTSTRWSFGNDESLLDEYAWFSGNSGDQTHPVGEKQPNPWGLYDMHGNVQEWCADDWHGDYKGAPTDGSAWIDSPRAADRVYRGGGWFDSAWLLRSVRRNWGAPSRRDVNLGFRLARPVTAR